MGLLLCQASGLTGTRMCPWGRGCVAHPAKNTTWGTRRKLSTQHPGLGTGNGEAGNQTIDPRWGTLMLRAIRTVLRLPLVGSLRARCP